MKKKKKKLKLSKVFSIIYIYIQNTTNKEQRSTGKKTNAEINTNVPRNFKVSWYRSS